MKHLASAKHTQKSNALCLQWSGAPVSNQRSSASIQPDQPLDSESNQEKKKKIFQNRLSLQTHKYKFFLDTVMQKKKKKITPTSA